MPQRARDQYTEWANEQPLTDIYQILAMLEPRQQGRYSDRRWIYSRNVPELQIRWCREADSGGDSGSTEYLEIDPEAFERLVEEGLVAPNMLRYGGGVRLEGHKLVPTDAGRSRLRVYLAAQREAARKLVVPGEHTKFSATLFPQGQGYEGFHGEGPLYFEFVTPMNERLRVYPRTNKVERIDQ